MKLLNFILALAFGFALVNCTSALKNGGRNIAQATDALAGAQEWAELQNFVATLDTTSTSGTTLKLHTGGGDSIYAEVIRDGKAIGALIPEGNSSGNIAGETLSYTLSRAFGFPELYQPSIYFRIKGANYEAFKKIVPSSVQGSANKQENREKLVQAFQQNPDGFHMIFKKWSEKPKDFDALVTNNGLDTNYTLPGGTASLVSLMSCLGSQPSKSAQVNLNGATTTEFEAAKQLASTLLIDAIMGQWDRFSGGNLQTITKNGVAQFYSADNGGTHGGTGWIKTNLSYVSRFERNVAQRIIDLNNFLNKSGAPFLGLKTEEEVMQALGAAENFRQSFGMVKKNLAVVAAHIEANKNCFFE